MKNNYRRIGLLQQEGASDYNTNIKKTLSYIKKAVSQKVEIICTTELFSSKYFCKNYDVSCFDLAEPVPGPTVETLSRAAAGYGTVILASVFEREGPLYFNTLAVIDADGTYLGKYRKMHIPDDPGFYEKYYFTPGDLGYKVFDTAYGRIGTLVCWDQWFPEAARLTAMAGADLLVYPTAIAALESETKEQQTVYHQAWRTVQLSHAITNGCHVAAINRTGDEEGMRFWGGSLVAGPMGSIIEEGGDDEEIVIADCNWQHNREVRREWPFFRDRRVDSYQGLQQKWLDTKSNG